MNRRRYSTSEMTDILCQVDRKLDETSSLTEACRLVGISRSTCLRWQKKLGLRDVTDSRQQVVTSLQKALHRSEQEVKALRVVAAPELSCPERKRDLVVLLQRTLGWSERQACQALCQHRSTQRYQSTASVQKAAIRVQLLQLKNQFPAWGARKLLTLLAASHPDVRRYTVNATYRRLNLASPFRIRAQQYDPDATIHRATRPDEIWACDFTTVTDTRGKPLHWLAVVDEFTRECVLLDVHRSLTSKWIVRALEMAINQRGTPESIRTDHAKIWKLQWVQSWLEVNSIQPRLIRPASPWENGVVESFIWQLQRELLNRVIFRNVRDARNRATAWMQLYNTKRPHGSLQFRTPHSAAAHPRYSTSKWPEK